MLKALFSMTSELKGNVLGVFLIDINQFIHILAICKLSLLTLKYLIPSYGEQYIY